MYPNKLSSFEYSSTLLPLLLLLDCLPVYLPAVLAECPGDCSLVCGLLNECRGQPTTGCNFAAVLCMRSHGVSLLYCIWAARYNTWLLIKLTPKGVVLSFLFFSYLYCCFDGWFLCSCSEMSSCWACWMRRTAIPSTAKQVSQADPNSVQDSALLSLQLAVCILCG